VSYFGTIAAIREMVVRGHGLAVLPEYYVRSELQKKRLVRVLTSIKPRDDQFRLVFRKLDSRRSLFQWLCDELRKQPLC
jgi:DNA-binding transcriptional LysR family regulator